MNLSTEQKWIIGGFSLAMVLTGLAGYASYLNAAQLQKSISEVKQGHILLTSLTDLDATVLDVELQRRNYLLYKDQDSLARYYATVETVDHKVHLLYQQVAHNSPQYQQLVNLEALANQRRLRIDQSLPRIHQDRQSDKADFNHLRGKNWQIHTKIQQLITAMQTSEEQQIQQSVEQDQANLAFRFVIDLLSTILSFVVLSSLFALHHRQMLKRQHAEIERQYAETQQQTLAQEKELSEHKLRFFSMASHEFRTPLSLILGSAQLLIEDIQNSNLEKKRTNLERIQFAARAMNRLLTDMLTLTRAEAGKLEFVPTLLDVESFCLNLIEDLQVLNELNHPIQFISSGYCTSAYLDEKLLYSILSNLLSNAIKYSPLGGMIQFSLNCTSQAIIFQIKDQGIGIPAAAQPNLYEPFYRAGNVGTIAGTGLGLAVVKKCVDLHRGQISLESEVEVGTTVTVCLPCTAFSK